VVVKHWKKKGKHDYRARTHYGGKVAESGLDLLPKCFYLASQTRHGPHWKCENVWSNQKERKKDQNHYFTFWFDSGIYHPKI